MSDKPKADDTDLDVDPDVSALGEFEEDGTADVIRQAYDKLMADDGDEDDVGLHTAPDDVEDKIETVSQEEGKELADESALGGGKDAKEKATAEETEDESDEAAKADAEGPKAKEASEEDGKEAKSDAEGAKSDEEGTKSDKEPEQSQEQPADLTDAEVADLLAGVDEPKAQEIQRRIGAADAVMKLFDGRGAELERMGTTPEGAMERLIYLNDYAQKNPTDYLAWAAQQMGGDKVEQLLTDAAGKLGLKLTKAAEPSADDDLYADDPNVQALRQRNAELERQNAAQTQVGPDNPQERAQFELNQVINETGPDGLPLRPYFQALGTPIAAKARAHLQATGRAVTRQDLARFYDEVMAERRPAPAPTVDPVVSPTAQPAPAANPQPEAQPTSAAQPEPAVQDSQKAADIARAKKASKSVDGTGQGASRRPALSKDADPHDVVAHFYDQQSE